jgi:hypothetical protein
MTDKSASLSLSALMAGDVGLEWYEGVAIVQAICERLSAEHDPNVPDLREIEVAPDGNVAWSAKPSKEQPVKRLGLLLNALLEGTSPPTGLRLFASEMTAPIPRCGSLEDCSKGLAYFERPDRASILKAFHERAVPIVAAGAARASQKTPTRPSSPNEKPATEPARAAARRQKPRSRLVIAVTGLLFASGLALFGGWQYVGRQSQVRGRLSLMLSQTTHSARTIAAAAESSGRRLLDATGLASASQAKEPQQSQAEEPAISQAARPSRPAASPVDVDALPAADSVGSSAMASTAGGSESPRVAATSMETAALATAPVQDERTYTADDAGISPPVPLSHPLRTEPGSSSDTSADGTSQVDLVIDENGFVRSVAFVTPPGRFDHRLLLSALKALQFQPAMKNGHAVRFRYRMQLPGN